MARARSPNRDKALKIWLKRSGNITNREIAEMLGRRKRPSATGKVGISGM
ncbi:phage terminase small subunit-related protein [Paenibacillus larvae]